MHAPMKWQRTVGLQSRGFSASAPLDSKIFKAVHDLWHGVEGLCFTKPGQRIDVSVSAIGKATNLRGGSLLLTSMRGANGEVYALAQGPLTATGIDAAGAGSKVVVGVPTSGRIPNGGIVEREVLTPFEKTDFVVSFVISLPIFFMIYFEQSVVTALLSSWPALLRPCP